jgi:hypothetical protein
MKAATMLTIVAVVLGLMASTAGAQLTLPYYDTYSGSAQEYAFKISNTNAGTGVTYGGFFYANSGQGRGVFGQADGDFGIGVKGWAKDSGNFLNYGGHFCATGQQGVGVYGWAENAGNVVNYGGKFVAQGVQGVGVHAKGGANGFAGVFEGDIKIVGAGKGIIFPDGTKQTTAGGGGTSTPFTGGPVRAEATAPDGMAFFGHASNNGDVHNYGGYFTSDGQRGVGVNGTAMGTKGNGVEGTALGRQGTAICGYAKYEGAEGNTSDVPEHYAGYFVAEGKAWQTGSGSLRGFWNSGYGTGIYAKGGKYAANLDGNVRIAGSATIESNTTIKGRVYVQDDAGKTLVYLGPGMDYAEGFDVTDTGEVRSGMVLVIDPGNAGKLTLSTSAYDTKVAGIVAGANRLGSGVRLGTGQFDQDVALAGRVYCNVDATGAAVQPGDLLTTSVTPGYAMKVSDHVRAQGAILGKAMESLELGKKGQILVLVTLQ